MSQRETATPPPPPKKKKKKKHYKGLITLGPRMFYRLLPGFIEISLAHDDQVLHKLGKRRVFSLDDLEENTIQIVKMAP